MAEELNDHSGSEWVKFTSSTWDVYRPLDRDDDLMQHPAKFPEELAKDHIEFFTQSGDTVFDPFAGTGTTIKVAENLSREGLGVELNGEYVKIARDRLDGCQPSEMLNADIQSFISNPMCDKVVPSIDFVFTSPPYWDVLDKSRGGADTTHKERECDGLDISYTDDSRDLGNIHDYDVFIDELVNIFKSMQPLLADGAYLAIVAQNVRDEDGVVRPIAYDIPRELSEIYTLKGERLWLQDDKQSAIWGYPSEYVSGKSHHIINILKNE